MLTFINNNLQSNEQFNDEDIKYEDIYLMKEYL